jgi:hypothetical protein
MYGLNIDMDNTTATNGNNYMYGLHVTPTLTHAADAGGSFVYGALINAQGGTNGSSLVQGARIEAGGGDFNYGLQLDVEDGGVDLRIESSADSGDYFQIQTTTNGATTITTVDDNATAAHLTFNVDGNITLDPAGGNVVVDGSISGSGNLQIAGTATFSGDVAISGSTPFLSIGDGGAEDCGIFLNSTGSGMGGIDYYVAIDYSYNSNNGALMIGAGEAVGSNSAIQIHNGRIGISHNGVTPSSFALDAAKHVIVGSMDGPLPAHNANETVIAQAVDAAGQALKVPRSAAITRVVLVVKTASNLSTHDAAVFLASDSNAAVDSTLSDKAELLGAGASGTRSTITQDGATDIDLKQAQRVWINNDLQWADAGDRYVYLVNVGAANGTTTSSGCSVVVYIEYYGAAP